MERREEPQVFTCFLLSFYSETLPKCLCYPTMVTPCNVQALKLLAKRLVRTLIKDKENVKLTKKSF